MTLSVSHRDTQGEVRTMFAAFGDLSERIPGAWWRHFVRPGWSHCFVFYDQLASAEPEPMPGAMVVNCLAHSLTTQCLLFPAERIAEALTRDGWHVLRVEARTPHGYIQRGLWSCVTVAKAVIGIRAPLVLTPEQLYRHLLARCEAQQYGDSSGSGRRCAETGHDPRSPASGTG